MTLIPRTPKRFAKWRAKQPTMPADLQAKANDVQIVHDILANNRNAKDFAAIKLSRWPAVFRFEQAHAAWEKSR